MRIVLCDYSGHPFQVELSRCLARRGHSVLHLHFSEFQTPKGALVRLPGDPPEFEVEGVGLGRPFDKNRFFHRRFAEAEIGSRIARRALAFAPDIVVGCNMPLDAQRKLMAATQGNGAAFVFWLQDIYSEAIAFYLGEKFGPLGRLVGLHYRHLEAKLLRRSDAVVPISEKFVDLLEQWGIGPDRIRVIPNWAPLSEIVPTAKDNPWARSHGLHDKPVALYTGTLGLKHDPALLLELARAGVGTGLQVVIVSEGPGSDWLTAQKHSERLPNLTILPFQSMESYSQVLGSGDVLIAMVGKEAAHFSVPSKILSYLAAGKPIVAAIAAGNDAAHTIAAAQSGFVISPGNSIAFIDRVIALSADPEMRESFGWKARAFAEKSFAIDGIANRFENLFLEIAQY